MMKGVHCCGRRIWFILDLSAVVPGEVVVFSAYRSHTRPSKKLEPRDYLNRFRSARIQHSPRLQRDSKVSEQPYGRLPWVGRDLRCSPRTCGVTMVTPARSSFAARPASLATMPVPAHGPHCTLKAGTPCRSGPRMCHR